MKKQLYLLPCLIAFCTQASLCGMASLQSAATTLRTFSKSRTLTYVHAKMPSARDIDSISKAMATPIHKPHLSPDDFVNTVNIKQYMSQLYRDNRVSQKIFPPYFKTKLASPTIGLTSLALLSSNFPASILFGAATVLYTAVTIGLCDLCDERDFERSRKFYEDVLKNPVNSQRALQAINRLHPDDITWPRWRPFPTAITAELVRNEMRNRVYEHQPKHKH